MKMDWRLFWLETGATSSLSPRIDLGNKTDSKKRSPCPLQGEKGFAVNSVEPLARKSRKTLDSLAARLNKGKDVVYFT